MSKRKAAQNKSLVAVKRQAASHLSTVEHGTIAEVVPTTDPRCRFFDDGYLKAVRDRHASEDRYRDFFHKNSLEDISRALHGCLSSTLLQVLDDCKEDDLDA